MRTGVGMVASPLKNGNFAMHQLETLQISNTTLCFAKFTS
jgi:hypothetical protein